MKIPLPRMVSMAPKTGAHQKYGAGPPERNTRTKNLLRTIGVPFATVRAPIMQCVKKMHPRRLSQPARVRRPSSPAGCPGGSRKACSAAILRRAAGRKLGTFCDSSCSGQNVDSNRRLGLGLSRAGLAGNRWGHVMYKTVSCYDGSIEGTARIAGGSEAFAQLCHARSFCCRCRTRLQVARLEGGVMI